mmetsp:Transcript_41131/g.53975  ORF Transcript_41131/g.53975 Transcript_41131/m.53975 type:complete len:170 (+) Transcript_41131:850-1359(+)
MNSKSGLSDPPAQIKGNLRETLKTLFKQKTTRSQASANNADIDFMLPVNRDQPKTNSAPSKLQVKPLKLPVARQLSKIVEETPTATIVNSIDGTNLRKLGSEDVSSPNLCLSLQESEQVKEQPPHTVPTKPKIIISMNSFATSEGDSTVVSPIKSLPPKEPLDKIKSAE